MAFRLKDHRISWSHMLIPSDQMKQPINMSLVIVQFLIQNSDTMGFFGLDHDM
uniref:Protease Do-like 2, chloroplastic n=1 Tax=Solanum tuberosum TaxID=4113 RepID=M1BEK5_SOLTU